MGFTPEQINELALIFARNARVNSEDNLRIRKDGTEVYSGTGDGFKDEDDMTSDSAVATASQQSIKAYVDGEISGVSVESISKDYVAGENIADGDAVFISDGTEVISSGQSNDGSSLQDFGNATGGNKDKVAQSFQLSEAAYIAKVKVKLRTENSPTDGVVITLEADNAGVPSGTPLATVTKDYTDLTATLTEYTVTFDASESLAASTTYWLVFDRSGAGNDTNKYSTAKGGTYTGGQGYYINVGGSWTDLSADLHFDLLIEITSGRVYRTRATDLDFMDTIGVADSAKLITETVAVVCEGIKTKAGWGLTPYSRYYLSETAGAITTTSPTNVKIIGYSLSATELLLSFTAGGRTDISNQSTKKSFTAGEAIAVGDAVGLVAELTDETTNPSIVKSAYVREDAADTNYDPGLQIHKRTGSYDREALCYWTASDLTDLLPSGATLLGIKFLFYVNTKLGATDTSLVYLNDAAFDETTVTWNTKPSRTLNMVTLDLSATGLIDTGWYAISEANWDKLVAYGITIIPNVDVNNALTGVLDDETDSNPPYIHIKYKTLDGKVYKVEATAADRAASFVGIADTADVAGGSVDVNYGGVDDNQTGLTISAAQYLSDTAGVIAESQGTVAKKIGMAVSATEILLKNDN